MAKLDRSLVNEEWLHSCPNSFTEFFPPGISDHSPFIVSCFNHQSLGPRPFKFMDMWLADKSLYPIVERAWNHKVKGNPMFSFIQKLKVVKNQIKEWNREVFGRIDIQVPIIRKSLLKIQASIEQDPASPHLLDQEAKIRVDLLKFSSLEKSFLKQKSRAQWLKLGDSNSKFFYSHLKVRQNKNNILAMKRGDGTQTTDPVEISSILINHFSKILNLGKIQTAAAPDPIRKLNVEDADILSKPISSEEIKDMVWKTNGDKAPGPDGFNASFFRAFWYLLGDEFIAAIKKFFKSGKLLKSVNATFISLIPKGPDSSSPSQYRPISLCTFLYKTITKILANRLLTVISNLISPSQSAFIRGRQIQDNILLTHDLLHSFHLPSPTPSMCLKIDLAKAFDNINRQALLSFMAKQGFNSVWLGWIEECISNPSFSILVNGSPQSFFTSSNGLRQGDPLSPLLFSISMEMLSVLLENASSSNALSTPFVQGSLAITHLLFADDLMIFAKGSTRNASILSSCLSLFHKVFGMEANPFKSEIFFRGTILRDKLEILKTLGFEEGTLPIRYIGLPLFTSRLTVSDCAPLITKVRKRIIRLKEFSGPSSGEARKEKNRITQSRGKKCAGLKAKEVLELDFSGTSMSLFESSRKNPFFWKPSSITLQLTLLFEKPAWASRIWFSGHIPRHALVSWKALNNGLSTTDNLPFLDPSVNRSCILCNSGQESVNHLFFQCSYSKWVWKSILGKLQLWRNPEPDLIQEELWIANHFKGAGQSSTLAFIAFEASIYTIWMERNHRIFRKTFLPNSVLLSETLSLIRTKMLGLNLTDVDTISNRSIAANFGCPLFPKIRSPQVCCWHKPNQGTFKINSDASLDADGGGMGGAIRDNNGFLLSMFSVNVEQEEILALEIRAVLEGLRLASSWGLTKIWIEVDSKTAADIIMGTSKTPWKCFTHIQVIPHLLSRLVQWKVSHIWREGNSVADYLSKRNCPCKGYGLPPFLAPPALLLLLDSDRRGSEYSRL
ncbi:uncharacterized protein LOC143861436 [Tasmannia lanceolata]|uniref:uncharacterized protein LOC143861436 n=1 Tax=Tasmannia lanceolata TaxID=3420 RepID=UPI0040628E08